MTNVIMYKSSDTFSQLDEKEDLLCEEDVSLKVEETLHQYVEEKIANIDSVRELEEKFESALIASKISYCRSNRLVAM
ncbi:hypothetical protein GCM10027035_37050 [Emticicia sediminis]